MTDFRNRGFHANCFLKIKVMSGRGVRKVIKDVPVLPEERGRGRGRSRGRGRVTNDIVPVETNERGRGRGRGRSSVTKESVPAASRGRGRPRKLLDNCSTQLSSATTVDDFMQATSSNLPTIDFWVVAEYFQLMRTPEQRHAKDNISAGEDYGDSAIGYVKVKRTGPNCSVEAKITPQTSVNSTPYNVSVTINEIKSAILQASCSCQASMVNCKHKTSLIFWILRRSEEPSPTEVECYWRKSKLSAVKGIKAKSVDELSGVSTDNITPDDSVLKQFILKGETINQQSTIVRYGDKHISQNTLYMDHLVIQFMRTGKKFVSADFLSYCQEQMNDEICEKIFIESSEQSQSAQWFYLRFGRITASKLFEASRCDTPEGALVAAILGSRRFKGNVATKRGQELEPQIFKLLEGTHTTIRKCGIAMIRDLPQFGASPNGLSDQYVFEIKCPSKKKTVKHYVHNGIVQDKVLYQIQMQMAICRRDKGILVIADPDFENNKKITEIEVPFEEEKLNDVIGKARKFWEKCIFPLLK